MALIWSDDNLLVFVMVISAFLPPGELLSSAVTLSTPLASTLKVTCATTESFQPGYDGDGLRSFGDLLDSPATSDVQLAPHI